MANEFIISRVVELPDPLVANTMYIVRQPGSTRASVTFTGANINDVGSLLTITEVEDLVERAVTDAVKANKSVFIVADIAAMHALEPTIPVIAYVRDTSDDPTAQTASGSYVFSPESGLWLPMNTGGSVGPVTVAWGNIIGRPSSSAASIDQAVQEMHTHTNRAVLDKFGESGGKATFSGEPISQMTFANDW